ncbi:hypothetical protein TEA_028240 [Camellia sinensis var. sinensis]|uniref:ABC-2 type transporter transmembrane domain-containing protein n=1 Tax=Camellia sinensis var. sinensis TaxID=542762 RepID=A0A4V3WNT7_CAMSN|nr:hypothetical protein TEA_028240 [Camellia sinensis var. sinensis]
MAMTALAGDDLARSISRRMSISSASKRGWGTGSIREAFTAPGGDTISTFTTLVIFILGGFIISKAFGDSKRTIVDEADENKNKKVTDKISASTEPGFEGGMKNSSKSLALQHRNPKTYSSPLSIRNLLSLNARLASGNNTGPTGGILNTMPSGFTSQWPLVFYLESFSGRKELKCEHKEQDLMNLLGAIYAAVFFLGATNTCTVQPVVAVERTVFYRERAAGMYSPLPYAFAQVAIETIYVAIQTLVYAVILYVMIGFPWHVEKFISFYYYIAMCFIYLTLYGMMVVALTPNIQIASIAMSFFLSFWNLFSGFLLPRTLPFSASIVCCLHFDQALNSLAVEICESSASSLFWPFISDLYYLSMHLASIVVFHSDLVTPIPSA